MSGSIEYECPKCHYAWESLEVPIKCWNCDFDWPEPQKEVILKKRISTLFAVIEQCEGCLRSIVGDRTKEHFRGNGPGSIAGEFDVKDLHMALDALSAIKQVKQ